MNEIDKIEDRVDFFIWFSYIFNFVSSGIVIALCQSVILRLIMYLFILVIAIDFGEDKIWRKEINDRRKKAKEVLRIGDKDE
jgi:hypothetical protein